jgi:hypothetical protein
MQTYTVTVRFATKLFVTQMDFTVATLAEVAAIKSRQSLTIIQVRMNQVVDAHAAFDLIDKEIAEHDRIACGEVINGGNETFRKPSANSDIVQAGKAVLALIDSGGDYTAAEKSESVKWLRKAVSFYS